MNFFWPLLLLIAAILLLLAGLSPLLRGATTAASEPRRGWPFALFLVALVAYETVVLLFLPELVTIWPELLLGTTGLVALRAPQRRVAARATRTTYEVPTTETNPSSLQHEDISADGLPL